jgi:hypothetical protein
VTRAQQAEDPRPGQGLKESVKRPLPLSSNYIKKEIILNSSKLKKGPLFFSIDWS